METQRQGGFLIAKIHQLSQRIFARILRDANLTELNPAQGRIMFILWRTDNISIHELSKRTLLSKSTLTSMLDRLEQAGFIKRVSSKKDRREILIQLTEKNKTLQEKYVDVSKNMTKIYYNDFTPEEMNNFENKLQKILDNLIEYNKKKV
ncbi:MAG: MarR family winged helix-turn-helix transcriptional regulator [Promethearchaeota archaeon]|jgi:DNA-binding MarR family transcriptional regulator